MAWEDNPVLEPFKAVPDSCCLRPTEGCGRDIFREHSLKKMADYVKKIHVHGCLYSMEKVLKVSFSRNVTNGVAFNRMEKQDGKLSSVLDS